MIIDHVQKDAPISDKITILTVIVARAKRAQNEKSISGVATMALIINTSAIMANCLTIIKPVSC
jgi:hypothetical protein